MRRTLFRCAAGLAALQTLEAFGCTACYGASDSPLAAGMNWGILTLLGVTGLMLGGVAAFFVYLARRTAKLAASTGAGRAEMADPCAPRPGLIQRSIRPLGPDGAEVFEVAAVSDYRGGE